MEQGIIKEKRRNLGEHFTSTTICKGFIIPQIKDRLYDYTWIDLFSGEGNLILPILDLIPKSERDDFFKEHIYLFDIQEKWVKKSIKNASKYGISLEIAKKNIQKNDSLRIFPTSFLKDCDYPIYHITNPPFLYIGYIVKTDSTQQYLPLFEDKNEGYQDLYQLAMMNDLRKEIQKLCYIVPSNFLYGESVSNKIRDDFFLFYKISKAIIFEKKIFEHTGMNVILNFFKRKEKPKKEPITFEALKINKKIETKQYKLIPKYHYRAGSDFKVFLKDYKISNPLRIQFYLKNQEVLNNTGDYLVDVIDANSFIKRKYKMITLKVNQFFSQKIKSNILWVRTVDSGNMDGRAGLYIVKNSFKTDGILVTKSTYRTHPIQLFFDPKISKNLQISLLNYFNLILEFFRDKFNNNFLTTYKYNSNGEYTRKYLGLKQTKKIIQTFPGHLLSNNDRIKFIRLIEQKKIEEIIFFLQNYKKK